MVKLINLPMVAMALTTWGGSMILGGCYFPQSQSVESIGSSGENYAATILPKSKSIISQSNAQKWRLMTEIEQARAIELITNRSLGIAALNQLAIEQFVGVGCERKFYLDTETEYQILLQVRCSKPRGVSTAIGYNEVRVIFSKFEDNIENFKVERISEENRDRFPTLPN